MAVLIIGVIDYGESHTDRGEYARVTAHFLDKPGNDGRGVAAVALIYAGENLSVQTVDCFLHDYFDLVRLL